MFSPSRRRRVRNRGIVETRRWRASTEARLAGWRRHWNGKPDGAAGRRKFLWRGGSKREEGTGGEGGVPRRSAQKKKKNSISH